MKIKIILSLVALVSAFIVFSCDIIEPPYEEDPTGNGLDTSEVVRKFLIEEFTGHYCKNCPEAADMIKSLESVYGERLLVVAFHVTEEYAKPRPEEGYPADYRTETGTALADKYRVSEIGLPSAMISRIPYNNIITLPTQIWERVIRDIPEEPDMSIGIDASFELSSRKINIAVDIEYLSSVETEQYLTLYLTESGIVGPQLSKEGKIEEYEFNHMFRAAVNGTWGELLKNESISTGEEFSETFEFTADADWVIENMSVIAMIRDGDTDEILQAEEFELGE